MKMADNKKDVKLEEGSIRKGGLGNKPSTPRPEPPKAQNVSTSDSGKTKK